MRRGFKADSERRSAAARLALGLSATAKLCPWDYADELGVLVYDANDLDLPAKDARQLLVTDPESWDGLTLLEDGVHLIVLNPTRPQTRRAATLMHELAHICLQHVPAEISVSPSGLVLVSDYSAEQEEEADWLGATLLLPEAALIQYRSQGMSPEAIAQIFGVSAQLCHWRCRMTGVEKRLAFRRQIL